MTATRRTTTRPRTSKKEASQAIPAAIAAIRHEYLERSHDEIQAAVAPIRIMARMVGAIEAECRDRGYPEALIHEGVVNRTIGDVDTRAIVEHDARYDYRTIADELGIALPGESIGGLTATGDRYLMLRERMMAHERTLLARHYDMHMYDLVGTGNPLLREWLCADQESQWGLKLTPAQILLSMGSLDGLDKIMRALRVTVWAGAANEHAIVFPSPGFNVPEWQATTLGLETIRIHTEQSDGYRLTADQLRETLSAHPNIRGVYITLSNNPTACSYSPKELRALLAVIAEHPDTLLLADMAYTGTGDLEEERARMKVFAKHPALKQVIFFWSLSKVYTMTGDRFGWVSVGDPALAARLGVGWANTIASLAAEWQLRFMAFYELLRDQPEVREKISALYSLRRRALVRQLRQIDAEHGLFISVNGDDGGTVYNWSQLRQGEDAFSLFEKTGIAGVPGTAFGYSSDHIRLSIGIIPVQGWETIVAEDAVLPATPKRKTSKG